MESLFGSASKLIFSIGLCAAAFSSLMVNAVIGGGLLADSLGIGKTMNEKMPRLFTIGILLLGMLVAVFFRGNAIYALIMAQASSILGVPIIAMGLFLLLNNKKVMSINRNNIVQNSIAVFGFLLISVIVFFMAQKLKGLLDF